MVVYTSVLKIHDNDEITTDVGRTQADIIRNFTFRLEGDQFISEDILNVTFTRFGGFDPFSQSRVDVILNGQNIAGSGWPFGRTEPLSFEIEDVKRWIKTDGSKNKLIARVTQSPADGLNRWIVDSQITFNLNTEDPPPEPPKVDPPINDEKGGDPIDTAKIIGAIALIGGVLVFTNAFGRGLGRGVASR